MRSRKTVTTILLIWLIEIRTDSLVLHSSSCLSNELDCFLLVRTFITKPHIFKNLLNDISKKPGAGICFRVNHAPSDCGTIECKSRIKRAEKQEVVAGEADHKSAWQSATISSSQTLLPGHSSKSSSSQAGIRKLSHQSILMIRALIRQTLFFTNQIETRIWGKKRFWS